MVVASSVPEECLDWLDGVVEHKNSGIYGLALLGEPLKIVEPMTLQRQPDADTVRAKPRKYAPRLTVWLAKRRDKLKAADMAH